MQVKTPRQSGLLFFTILILIQLLLCNVSYADSKAKVGASPDKNSETEVNQHQDWVFRCGGEGITDDQCFIMQNIAIRESGQRLLGVAVGYLGTAHKPWLFLTTPLGISLSAGLALNIDGGEAINAQFHICLADGCRARIALDEKLIAALKQGKQAKVAFLDGISQKQITVEVALMGFSRGFEAL